MYRGFPVGYLLFWANTLTQDNRQIGSGAKQQAVRLLIVDGQQRLTSLYAVLKGVPVVREDFTKGNIHIAFRPRDQKFEVSDAATKRDPEFIPDISQLWSTETSIHRFVKTFFENLRKAKEVSEDEEDALRTAIDRLYDVRSYPFTALELSASVPEEEVADVFVRINSEGTPLNQADFILTLMSVFWDEGRAQLEAFSRESRQPSTGGASSFNHFIQPDPDQMLRVSVATGFRRAQLRHAYSILRGKDLETGQFSVERRAEQFEILKEAQAATLNLQHWQDFLKTLLRAGYRSGSMVGSKVGLLYSYSLFLVGRRDFKVELYVLRDVIARWFFMTSLTGRYSSSPEATMEEDLARVSDISGPESFVELLDGQVDQTFTPAYWKQTLPGNLVTAAARAPALFAYAAALNLLDARVLFSKLKVAELLDPASKAYRGALEKHHLFPKDYLKSIGISRQREINQIANYALVEWDDNAKISNKSPAKYLPTYLTRYEPEEIKEMYFLHALPEEWENLEYHEFLVERRKLMADVIRAGFERLKHPAKV